MSTQNRKRRGTHSKRRESGSKSTASSLGNAMAEMDFIFSESDEDNDDNADEENVNDKFLAVLQEEEENLTQIPAA